MRTTIDLPDDIHAAARGLARDQAITMSEAVVALIRRGLGEPGNVALGRSRRTGLPWPGSAASSRRTTSGRSTMPDDVARIVDANLLIALIVGDHVHHTLAEEWFIRDGGRFATCPTTQAALIRFLIREGATPADALGVLRGVTSNDRHEFWPDDSGFADVALGGVIGHRQVTDAYLAALARAHDSRLVTLDRTLAAIHPDVVDLVGAA